MQGNAHPGTCEKPCTCTRKAHQTKLVVLTGGPGAGKTAVLELVRKQLCEHVVILPEAASIVFGGGFWRLGTDAGKTAAQRAILHIQIEMESMALSGDKWALGLCDRGIPDGLAYWPGEEEDFWRSAGMTRDEAYARYHAVIHLRTPGEKEGYNHQNPLRTETAAQAAQIDARIHSVWSAHPRYRTIESTKDFMQKAEKAMQYILADLPECCRPASEA